MCLEHDLDLCKICLLSFSSDCLRDFYIRFEYPENSAYYSNKQEELSKKSPLGKLIFKP